MRPPLVLLALIPLVAMFAVSCSGGDGAPSADTQQLSVALSELRFEPASLSVQAGKPVQIKLRNSGTSEHDFVVIGMPATDVKNATEDGGHAMSGMNRNDEIAGHTKPKETKTIRFTPTQPGTYEYYCSITGHREAGMKGTLTVT